MFRGDIINNFNNVSKFYFEESRKNLKEFKDLHGLEKKARNEGNRLLANQNYGKKMDNLSKALYCTLRAEGIGKDEASFILKKFRNITPQNQEGSNVNYRPGKAVKSVPEWYKDYMADVRTTAENRNTKASSDQSIDQMLKEFDELK